MLDQDHNLYVIRLGILITCLLDNEGVIMLGRRLITSIS